VDSDTTCMDARRSLRKAPFQYSCEACDQKGGFETRSDFGQSVEEHDTEEAETPNLNRSGFGHSVEEEIPNSNTSLLIGLLALLVLVVFASFCLCCCFCYCGRMVRARRKERISDSSRLTKLNCAHIEPTREEIWISTSSSSRKNLNSIKHETVHSTRTMDSARSLTSNVEKSEDYSGYSNHEQSEDYGGYSDYEETIPSAPELYENMTRESTGTDTYDNMYL